MKHLPHLMLMLTFSTAQAGELADMLRASLDHPRAAARAADVAAAGDDLQAADARYYGQGSLVAGLSRYEHPRVVGIFTPGDPTPADTSRDIARAGVVYSLPIDLFGVVAKARERGESNLQAARLSQTQDRLARLHQTAAAWFRLQALARQAEALGKLKASVTAFRDRLVKEVALGKSARVNHRLAESEYQRVLADEAQLAAQVNTALAELEEASGQRRLPAEAIIPLPAWREPVLAEALPVKLAAARAAAARARAEEARRGNRPQLSLNGSWFNQHGDGADNAVWEAGVQVALPLTPSGWRSTDAAAARARAAEDERRAVERDTAKQFASLKAAYDSARASVTALEAEAAFRTEVVAVEREKTRLGAQTLENLLRTERDWLDAEYRLAASRAQAAYAWSAAQVLAGTPEPDYIETLDPK
ncbi:MAG: TolC family protein [Thiobacillaceae bacterium]